jgi:beta-ketoacyl synthase-like protein
VSVRGIGLLGPGLADWAQGQLMLREPAQWLSSPTVLAAPARLPPTERRRAGAVVKLAFAVADQACAQAGVDVHTLATVFTSTGADSANCHALCEALAQAERIVSPTRFTNSVHNAPAGYWHIAVQSRSASTSLAAYDASANAGLLEAAVQCTAARAPVLLVACDMPYPKPLHALRPLPDVFAFALLLVPQSAAAPWRLSVALSGAGQHARCESEGLERLRQAIPVARALPLLQALAREQSASMVIEAGGLDLALQVQRNA